MTAVTQYDLVSSQTITTTTSFSSVITAPNLHEAIGFLSVSAVSGTTPTLDLTIQTSHDNTNWVTVFTFTQVTSATTLYAVPTTFNTPFLKYARAVGTVAGTTPSFAITSCALFFQPKFMV